MSAVTIAYNIMSTNTALNTAVGGRISPLRTLQQQTFPQITYRLVSITPNPTKSGHSHTDFARVQISVYAPTYASVLDVSDKIRTAFESVSFPNTFNGVYCQNIEFDAQVELTDDEADFSGVFQISQDYIINYIR